MDKRRIKELIVVEGRHDLQRLENLFDCDVICTGGLALGEDVLMTIQAADRSQGVIIMTDPDYPGRKIRDEVAAIAPNAKHIFVNKEDAIGKRNVGIEYVSDEKLVELIEQSVTFTNKTETISRQDYLSFHLMNDKKKRDYLTAQLHIGQCNNKRLLKYLNMLGITRQEVEDILKDYE